MGCCFYGWEPLTLVRTCARQWSMDTCTHYCVSLYTCWEGRGWRQPFTGLMMQGERRLSLFATPLLAAHHAPASAPGLCCHPQSQASTPGCGTRSFCSWLATGMPKGWKNTARECGARIKNAKRPNGSMCPRVRREGKEKKMRTPTEHRGTRWTPEENRHWLHTLEHTHIRYKGQTHCTM